jgi:hypothetical protein
MGGLGNQLFQIFTALSYSIDHAVKIMFPYNPTAESCVFRKTYWNKNDFLDRLSIFTNMNYKNLDNHTLARFQKYRENDFTYSIIPKFHENTIMIGYFQSYKYFQKNQNYLFSLIKLSEKKNDILQKYSKYFIPLTISNTQMSNENVENISMHFRLGDYKYLQEYHPILGETYYRNALQLILDEAVDPSQCFQVLYFCEEEDNLYVQHMISQFEIWFSNRNVNFVKVSDSIVDWEQMLIMSCCKYNIIANSTFSWWGGYFNTIENKKVYYPCKWFGPKINHSMVDFFPEDWIEVQIS